VLRFVYFNGLCIGSGVGGGMDIQLFWQSFIEVKDQDTLIEQSPVILIEPSFIVI